MSTSEPSSSVASPTVPGERRVSDDLYVGDVVTDLVFRDVVRLWWHTLG